MRAALLLLVALACAGCARQRRAEPAPEIVAMKAAGADLVRLRALAAQCQAGSARVQIISGATFLIVDGKNSIAARDCFFAGAQADYRVNHPVRAWIEGLIG